MSVYSRLYRRTDPLVPVDKPVIGQRYHLSWARKHGMVWVLVAIDERGRCTLRTPKTHKTLYAMARDLRHTRKQQTKLQHDKR